MPQSGEPQSGAPRQAAEAAAVTDQDREHWAFQKVHRPRVPGLRDQSAAQTPIDAFLLAKLAEKKLALSPPADKSTLLRRAYLDLHGLPPSPQEVAEFVADPAPDAFARRIDRLLASPRFGERWGRHWLDVVGYADTVGFDTDANKHHLECRQVEVPRLRDLRLQRRQAVQPVPHRATGRRRAGRLAARPAFHAGNPRRPRRYGLPPHGPRPDARAGEQYPAQLLRRAARHGRDAGKQPVRPHGELCPLPLAQVRSDPAAGLLPPDGPLHAGLQPAALEARLRLEAGDQGPGDRRRLTGRAGPDRAGEPGRRPRRGRHPQPHVGAALHAPAQGHAQTTDRRALG